MAALLGRRGIALAAAGIAIGLITTGCTVGKGGDSTPTPSPTPEPRLWRGELTIATGRQNADPRARMLTLNGDLVTRRGGTPDQKTLTPEQLTKLDELIRGVKLPASPSTPKVGPSRRLDVTSDDGQKVNVRAQPGDEPAWTQIEKIYELVWG